MKTVLFGIFLLTAGSASASCVRAGFGSVFHRQFRQYLYQGAESRRRL